MKKLYFILGFLLAVNVSMSQVLTEDFSYAAGQLITANGWTAHSGAGTNAITVTSPGLTYSGHPGSGVGNAVTMTTSGEDDNKAITAINSGTVYMSFLIKLSAAQTAGDYFIGLFQTSSIFPIRIYAKSDGAGGFFFGVSKGSSAAVYETTARSFGTTYLVVTNYIFNAGTTTDDIINLWVNPALGGTETPGTIANVTGTSTDATSIAAVYLRQGSATNAPTQQIDAILVGTTWASVTPSAAVTTLNISSPLTAFGNVCTGATAGPNSFTITGSNLTTANVTIGALAGFTYSTTAGGTYTASLSLTQPGGNFSQQIFVNFTPVAAQSYNGNIAVAGGGVTTPITVAADGTGVSNSAPALTSGTATAVTTTTATVAGTITNTGCSAITAYGIEYSTTPGFANGAGTPAASTNLSSGGFTADLSGLSAATTYYYHAYATNTTGTGYGTEQSFATGSATPVTGIVLSQVYGGGGGTTGTYKNDYVELHNNGTTTQSLTGLSIQYGSATGNFGSSATNVYAFPAGTSIPAGRYLLIQLGPTGSGGVDLPVTPDLVTTNLTMSGSSGKVVLANQVTGLGCGATATPCTLPSATIIDLVAFGAAGNAEGGVAVNNGVALTSTQGAVRKNNGCTDTDNNNNDFDVVTAPVPRNSASPLFSCSAGPTPVLSISSPLTAFGNVCISTTAGPNSFTITGSNLTTANVTIGALAGFTYSTTAGGTYTASLSLTQPGGNFSQQIFVNFTPVAAQSYNGNIAVAGGGVTTSITVAADGTGVSNSAPALTTGTASAVTTTTATLAGTITNTGCSAITAYGIEYSTTPGFVNGSGTPVASTNLSGAGFSADLTGLSAATTYYYHAYATNTTGTGYGTEQSFATGSATPVTGIVLSQVYGGGGGSTGTYKNDYVELHNNGTTTQSLTGLSLQYGSSTGNFGSSATNIYAFPAGTSIPSGRYLLIQLGPTGSGGLDLPVTPDLVTTNLTMSGISGKVVLANQATALGCGATATPCTLPSATIIDLVAYGAAGNAEGGVAVNNGVALTSTQGAVRKNNGCTDTDNNNNDFDVVTAPVPRNSASPLFSCSAGPTPVLSISSPLTAFGNVCTNATGGPNSFTISGSNLTTANVTVGALPGYSYSTNAGGVYTASLNLTQPGGTYSQQIFVIFTPTAVQSYNGNIAIAGGGVTTPVNAAASGAGVNTMPSVTTGAASAITQTTATAAGSITANGCTPVTAYGIEYSTLSGFTPGTGTTVAATNLAAGNFSSALSGLVPSTNYFYRAYATNGGGTAYGAEQSFTSASLNPTINVTALTAFGNICATTTAGPNSFTISGANLTAANVTVGALAGYTYSTTAGGTYTATLSLAQTGGTYSQQVFVRFTPTVVQSYNGNIPVAGGGTAAAVNVAAAGAGVNTPSTVTTGAASAITQTTATTAGSITSTGCSAIAAYGIEYSLTNGFPNGTGTAVASTNLAGGNFTSALSGLLPATTYYYKAFATNNGGTAYGVQQTFTTTSPLFSTTALTPFGTACVNTTAGPNSFTITGTGLSATNITVGPLTGFTFATSSGGTYSASLNLTQPGGAFSQTVFVKFNPTAVQSYNGNIPVSGGGAATINVAAAGDGVNTLATVQTGGTSNLSTNSVTLAGTVSANGCSNVTAYGIEYSGVSGFASGSGTPVSASNLAGGNFTSSLTGLVQGATYYYKAYAVNGGGTSYGLQQSFTVSSIGNGFVLYPVPVDRGATMRVTMNNLTPGYYGLLFYNSEGQLVYQKDMNIQSTFINEAFTIPATLAKGIYRVQLMNYLDVVATKTILVL